LFFPASTASVRFEWASFGLPLAVLLSAVGSFAAAGLILYLRWRGLAPSALQTPSAAALAATGLVQFWLSSRVWRSRKSPRPLWLSPAAWAGALLVGWLACYGLSLALGPKHAAGCVFAATAMAWATTLLLPFSASAETIDGLRRLVDRPGTRRCYQLICTVALFVLLGEGAVRGGAWLLGPEHFEPAKPMFVQRVQPAAPPASKEAEAAADGAADFDQTERGATPSKTNGENQQRVVILGDRLLQRSRRAAGAGVLPSVPADAHVFQVSIPEGGLSDYVRQGLPRVSRLRPELLLVIFSVGDDLVAEETQRSAFDWRGLVAPRALERWTGWSGSGKNDQLTSFAVGVNQPSTSLSVVGRWEDYVAACAPQLATCRKPVDATMQRRWKSTFACLGELEQACRGAKIRLGLIVAPSPLQTNRALLEAVCRRQGLAAANVDLELPQRRLAAYAAERRLPTLDLLPALRQSSEPAYAHQGWEWSEAGQSIVSRTLDGWVSSTFNDAFAAARPQVATAWNSGEQGRLVSQ
jgi:hypothetical protein